MDSVLFIRWGASVPGRELDAVDVYNTLLAFLNGQDDLTHQSVVLSAYGQELSGFVLVNGKQDRLDTLRRHPTLIGIVIQARTCMQGFGVLNGYTGDGVKELMKIQRRILS